MKRRLQSLSLFAAALLAVHLMAQDNGGGGTGGADASGAADSSGASSQSDQSSQSSSSSGASSSSNSGASSNSGQSSSSGQSAPSGGSNGIFDQQTPLPSAGVGQGAGGNGNLFGPGTAPGGQGAGLLPGASPAPTPGTSLLPIPDLTGTAVIPSPFGFPTPSRAVAPAAAATPSPAPMSLTIPGGYGGSASQTFTLGEGRLAKPPITFSFDLSQGYDDNIFSAPSHYTRPQASPTPTPPLEARLITFRITPPLPPTPVYQFFRPKLPAASPSPTPLGVLGSAVTTASVAAHVQIGRPRTVIIMDASVGEQYYWNQPGNKQDFTGSFNLQLAHQLTPRAGLTIDSNAVYQNTPNFALINAPTTNGNNGGDYLNGTTKIDLTYGWSSRLSTVTSYAVGYNILQSNSQQNLYTNSFGNQFRYTVSARNTVTAEIRETIGDYPSQPAANSYDTYYLLGLDSFISTKLRNTFSAGIESYTVNGSGGSQLLPYFESDTSLALPRGASLVWTNSYGSQESPSPQQPITSYRTALSLSQPLSVKLVASLSIAYNYLTANDTVDPAASYYQKQFQTSVSLGYTVSPRLSLSLSYNAFDFLTNIVNSTYQRDQLYFSGSYTFQ